MDEIVIAIPQSAQRDFIMLYKIHDKTRKFKRNFESLHDAERTIEALREIECVTSIRIYNVHTGDVIFGFGPSDGIIESK